MARGGKGRSKQKRAELSKSELKTGRKRTMQDKTTQDRTGQSNNGNFFHSSQIISSSAVKFFQLDVSRTLALMPLKPKAQKRAEAKKRKKKGQMRKEVKHSTLRQREAEQLVFSGEQRRVSFTLSQQISDRGSLAIPGLPRLMFGEF